MRQIDIIWLAGLLEGEGCFNVRPEKNDQARVSVEMTDKDIIERVSRLFDSNISTREPRPAGTCSGCKEPASKCIIAREAARGETPPNVLNGFGMGWTKRSYQTAIYGDRAKNLMRLVFPFMGSRRGEKIEAILGSLV